VLDGIEGIVDAGGFGDGFHEGIVPSITTVWLETLQSYINGVLAVAEARQLV
jgi:hypothetical protein